MFSGIKKFLRRFSCIQTEEIPNWVYDDVRERERQKAFRAFMARRGRVWPNPKWQVRLNNLYPDLSEFYWPEKPWQVKLKNLYPDLSEFY